MGPVNDVGMAVGVGQASNTNNFELGANKAPVPSTDNFLDGGSSGGPNLASAVPALPANIVPVPQGVTGDGNVAITHAQGVFNFQDVGVYGDLGIRCAGSSAGDCDDGTQNSFFNDPNQYPNTFNTGTQTGNTVNPNDADQSTRIDGNQLRGRDGDVGLLDAARRGRGREDRDRRAHTTSVLDASAAGGTMKPDTFDDISATGPVVLSTVGTTTLVIAANSAGLHVIDIETVATTSSSRTRTSSSTGPPAPSSSSGCRRRQRHHEPQHAGRERQHPRRRRRNRPQQRALLLQPPGQRPHFSFSNTVLNGAAFWTLGMEGGEINVSNGQGCTQFMSDKIALNDVRFARCAFVPEPRGSSLLAIALATLGGRVLGNGSSADGAPEAR